MLDFLHFHVLLFLLLHCHGLPGVHSILRSNILLHRLTQIACTCLAVAPSLFHSGLLIFSREEVLLIARTMCFGGLPRQLLCCIILQLVVALIFRDVRQFNALLKGKLPRTTVAKDAGILEFLVPRLTQ